MVKVEQLIVMPFVGLLWTTIEVTFTFFFAHLPCDNVLNPCTDFSSRPWQYFRLG